VCWMTLTPDTWQALLTGHQVPHGGGRRAARHQHGPPRGQGEAVQVEPMKPMLKAPGTKRLKL